MSRTYRRQPKAPNILALVRDGKRLIPVSPQSSKRYGRAAANQNRYQSLLPSNGQSTVRDGQLKNPDARHNGHRPHKAHRVSARRQLRAGDPDAILSGKKRRYGDRYDDAQ